MALLVLTCLGLFSGALWFTKRRWGSLQGIWGGLRLAGVFSGATTYLFSNVGSSLTYNPQGDGSMWNLTGGVGLVLGGFLGLWPVPLVESTLGPEPRQPSAGRGVATQFNAGRLSPTVLQQVARLGGVYRWAATARPQRQGGRPVPEPLRSFLDDIQWPHARYRGQLPTFDVRGLEFVPLPPSEGPGLGVGRLEDGKSSLLLRASASR